MMYGNNTNKNGIGNTFNGYMSSMFHKPRLLPTDWWYIDTFISWVHNFSGAYDKFKNTQAKQIIMHERWSTSFFLLQCGL